MFLINNIYKKLRNNTAALYPYLIVFTAAFVLRFIAWKIFGTYFSIRDTDSVEYFITSIDFGPLGIHKSLLGYDYWYERTPAYILYLHLTHRELIIQVLISSISCLIMYRLSKTAGILWMFYIQDIMYSFQYQKETLLLFFIILAIYLFKDNKIWLLIAIPLTIIPFSSFGGVIIFNHSSSKGFLSNFWNLWKPAFDIFVLYSKWFVYIQALPYTLMIIYFIRKTRALTPEFGLFLLLSITYSIIYGQPRYREPFMPLLFLFCAPAIEKFYIKAKNYIHGKNCRVVFTDIQYLLKKKIILLKNI